MKSKRLVIIIVALVIISTLFAVFMTVLADKKPAGIIESEARGDAEQTRTLETKDGKSELTYKETKEILSEIRRDVYTDENDNEYWYDEDGHIMMFVGNYLAQDLIYVQHSEGQTEAIDERDAKAIADAFAELLFGKEICGGFVYDSVSENGQDGVRTFTYTDKHGIVVFADIGVSVMPDGSVQRAVLNRNYYECKDFDKTLLDGVTEQQLLDCAQKQTGKSDLSLLGGAQLIKNDGKYCVLFTVRYDGTTEDVYYEL